MLREIAQSVRSWLVKSSEGVGRAGRVVTAMVTVFWIVAQFAVWPALPAAAAEQQVFTTQPYWSSTEFLNVQFKVAVTALSNGNASVDKITVEGGTPPLACAGSLAGGYFADFGYAVHSDGNVISQVNNYVDRPKLADQPLSTQSQAFGLNLYTAPSPGQGLVVHQNQSYVAFGADFSSYVWRVSTLPNPDGSYEYSCENKGIDQIPIGPPYGSADLSNEFTILIPTLTSSTPSSTQGPGGMWTQPTPVSGSTIGGPINLSATASAGSNPVSLVNFTAWWPALGPVSGPWQIVCSVAYSSAVNGKYNCPWNLSGVPAGEVRVSFDVWDSISK
ncbi:MAG TPA: hypothetical protein VLF67_02855, partial [Candidatus Saccharimonas sp.]|nr:hypothetical protein [Candidatus Saccharimonas sp.]